ncbi:MAG: topoisomerase DNA-binding C4 zinc finger domain-containing protein [Bifidobacterium sp.]
MNCIARSVRTFSEESSFLRNAQCGEALSLRHNRNDPNRSFYGCTGFPNCRYTQQAK